MQDYYALGSEEVGLFSPQNVLDDMNAINDAVDSLDRVISASDKARPEFKSSWETYRDTWRKFYAAHASGFTGWITRALNETHDQVQDYATRTKQWQEAIASEGLVLPGPSPLVERQDKVQGYVITGALVIGGVFVAYGLGKYALGRLFGD